MTTAVSVWPRPRHKGGKGSFPSSPSLYRKRKRKEATEKSKKALFGATIALDLRGGSGRAPPPPLLPPPRPSLKPSPPPNGKGKEKI